MIKIEIYIKRHHLLVLSGMIVFFALGLGVVAFGGGNPAVLGHSAGELIVDSTSIVDDSLAAADINSSSLASECSQITGSSGLCDSVDNGITSETDPQVSDSSVVNGICYTQSASTSVECNSAGFLWSQGAQIMTVGTGSAGTITMASGNFQLSAGGSPVVMTAGSPMTISPVSGFSVSPSTDINIALRDHSVVSTNVICWSGIDGSLGRCTSGVSGSGQCTCSDS